MSSGLPIKPVRLPCQLAGLLLLGALPALMATPAAAQGRLDARYEASLAGIPVGKGTWQIEITDEQYTATATGGSAGLLKAFSGGNGSTVASGKVVNGQLVPATYLATINYDSKAKEIIRLSLASGNIKESSIEPEPPVNPERIPVTEAHRKGVTDPMSGSLLRVAGTADPLSSAACTGSTSVFDGRLRYDLQLEFKRMEMVKVRGYQGPVAVCAIYFTPVAGYIPDRPAIDYLRNQRNMEVWLAPVIGTRVMVPFKVLVPTPLGTAALEATQFVSTPLVRASAKTQ